MNPECERTRKALTKYLHGHVFRAERGRIERHLGECVICRSEFEALRRTQETLQILHDINAAGGVVGRVKDGVSALGKIKKIFYHPLWIAGIALAAAAVIYYLMTPRQIAVEIDKIVNTQPTTSASPAPRYDTTAPGMVNEATSSAPEVRRMPAAPAGRPKKAPQPPVKPAATHSRGAQRTQEAPTDAATRSRAAQQPQEAPADAVVPPSSEPVPSQ